MASGRAERLVGKHAIRVGFVPLIDAAPLIVAEEEGFFADEGLDVRLSRQIGWGNVRDKLTYGHLHASHALIGMPPASVARLEYYHEPLVSLMSLGSGGSAITVSSLLAEQSTHSPALWRRTATRPLRFAHVFSCSSKHFFLRDFLSRGGVNLDRDAYLCVRPPPQLVTHLTSELLDGFCAGEPWNTLAVVEHRGTIVAATTELMADHPDKVLAVTRLWYEQNRSAAESLVRAVLRGCDFCDDATTRGRLAEILANPKYIGIDESIIEKSLAIDDWLKPAMKRPRFRSWSRSSTAPRTDHVEWIVGKMIQWGHLPANTQPGAIARASLITDAYAAAAPALRSTQTPVFQGNANE